MKDKSREQSDNFWYDLIHTNGKLDEEKVLDELSDYYNLLDEVPEVYLEVSGGMISKPNTRAFEVINEFHRQFESKGITRDDVRDIVNSCKTLEDLQETLSEYFDLDNEE